MMQRELETAEAIWQAISPQVALDVVEQPWHQEQSVERLPVPLPERPSQFPPAAKCRPGRATPTRSPFLQLFPGRRLGGFLDGLLDFDAKRAAERMALGYREMRELLVRHDRQL
jgi:hypothetical protein